MATLPTSKMPLGQFNAVTMRNWTAKRLKFRLRLQLTVNKVIANTRLTVAQRVRIAGQMLRDAIVVNLSRPVRKYKRTIKGHSRVDSEFNIKHENKVITRVDPKSRSKRGEFPRADTTRLLKSIFVKHYPEQALSRIGTNLSYGIILESRLDRSFLRRTLRELRREILLIVQHGSVGGL